MKNSKLNLVVLALVAVTASAMAQDFSGQGNRGNGWGPPQNRGNQDRGYQQDRRAMESAAKEVDSALRVLRSALPIYDGYRTDAIRDLKSVLDDLRKSGKKFRRDWFNTGDRNDDASPFRYRESELRRSNEQMSSALKRVDCAIDTLNNVCGRDDREMRRWIMTLSDARRDIRDGIARLARTFDSRGRDWDRRRDDDRRNDDRRNDDRRDDGHWRRG